MCAHTHTHTNRVTGHKEPLCQVMEHRERDKGLEGCDMTNMRGFCGPSGRLALQPRVTDTADLYHTSDRITAEGGSGHT